MPTFHVKDSTGEVSVAHIEADHEEAAIKHVQDQLGETPARDLTAEKQSDLPLVVKPDETAPELPEHEAPHALPEHAEVHDA